MVQVERLELSTARVSDEYSIPTELIAHTCHKEGPACGRIPYDDLSQGEPLAVDSL